MSETERYKEFVKYFTELKRQGIPYGLFELREKAVKLNLPIPKINAKGDLDWGNTLD